MRTEASRTGVPLGWSDRNLSFVVPQRGGVESLGLVKRNAGGGNRSAVGGDAGLGSDGTRTGTGIDRGTTMGGRVTRSPPVLCRVGGRRISCQPPDRPGRSFGPR